MSMETGFTSSEDFRPSLNSSVSQKPNDFEPMRLIDAVKSPYFDWNFINKEKKLIFFNMQKTNHTVNSIGLSKNKSLCSMNCVARLNPVQANSPHNISLGSTNTEQQVHITDLESNSLRIDSPNKSACNQHLFGRTDELKSSKYFDSKMKPKCFFFTHKNQQPLETTESLMKKSQKSTNLFKYRNEKIEPALKKPISKCLLLKNYRHPKHDIKKRSFKDVECDTIPKEEIEMQSSISYHNQIHKSLQNLSISEYDKITEKIMISIFEKHKRDHNVDEKETEFFIDQVVKELYDVKFCEPKPHPVIMLFRSLLEYWLKNTNETSFNQTVRRVKSVGKPSIIHFTRDKMLSSYVIANATKQTQFHGISDFINDLHNSKGNKVLRTFVKHKSDKKAIRCHSPKRDTESFEKERRIQELETILKNTVYVCETVRGNRSKERDIMITKKLINNLDKISNRSILENTNDQGVDNSMSSAELPKIQDTINRLISDMAMPADVAKDFLNAYLGILIDSSKSITSSSQSSEPCSKGNEPKCDVSAEPIQKRISKSIVTVNLESNPISSIDYDRSMKQKAEKDPGELYLKEVLDKITTIFTKLSKTDNQVIDHNEKSKGDKLNKTENIISRHINEFTGKNLIRENVNDNSLVIDLSKYDLEHISMSDDPKLKAKMLISIRLKEKPLHFGESKTQQLSLKFCDEKLKSEFSISKDDWVKKIDSSSLKTVCDPIEINLKKSIEALANTIPLRPYTSTSDMTSKAYCKILHESEHSIDMSFKSSKFFKKESFEDTEDPQSCYLVSSLKKNSFTTKLQPKRKLRLNPSNVLLMNTDNRFKSSKRSYSTKYPEEYTVFEQATPKIIDEKFILLLLENLTLLSKNIPSLFKDLNALYLKLKKKHDKAVRNCSNIQGLSLLGKIYNDDDRPNNRETQYDEPECKITSGVEYFKDAEINTVLSNKDLSANKAISTCNIHHDTKFTEVQTDFETPKLYVPMSHKNVDNKKNTVKIFYSITEIGKGCQVKDQSTSLQKFPSRSPTKECEISTVIRTVYDNSNIIRPVSLRRSKYFDNVHVMKVDKNFLNMKTDTLNNNRKEYYIPQLRTSIQSQTDNTHKINKGDILNYHMTKDLKVYQCTLSQVELRKSSSMMKRSSGISNVSDDLKTLYRCSSEPSYCSGLVSPTSPAQRGPQAGFVSGTPGGRLAGWIIESGGPLEIASRELGQAQLSVQQLQRLLEALELQHQVHHDTDVSLEGASPNVKKDRRKFGLRKKKSNSKCASVELAPPQIDPSSSHMALSTLTAPPSPGGGASSMPNSAASLPIACAAARPQSLPGAGAEALGGAGPASLSSLTPDHQLREDFTVLAKDLVTSLKSIVSTLVIERGRLRVAVEATDSASPGALLAALRTNLSSALHQNNELRSRLSRIHDASDLAEVSSMGPNSDPQVNRPFQQSLSYSSSCVSASEFFDAEEHDEDLKPTEVIAPDEAGVIELDGDSSSEAGSLSSEEGSASSDNSDPAMLSAEQVTLRLNQNGVESRDCWTRRTCLPSPRPTPGGPSLWNLLYKNIGKDLSQISMPVTINEPLNMLQRLCEELEYSELLDAAAECKSAVERMSLIAAFAVSAYASSAHRAASKPFNPLLAETYECVREDRGFRFIAEQVSHHPPISACHAESTRWYFWQEARIKTKFWGKSMEFQPAGRVHVRLATTGDHYSWNKVTTCVHNLFGGQRWVDQYGDMHITCHGTDISCKLNFIKASSWSSSRHEVRGAVYGGGGSRVRLQGRWSEALYAGEPPSARCLWRPGAMPPEHELYYGFTRFAMELNEMEPGMQKMLPHTDTRFRPDQRALELGDVESAEQYKHSLEQSQRERRRDYPHHQAAWFRKSVEEGEETWVFTGEYWKAREATFPAHAAPRIW